MNGLLLGPVPQVTKEEFLAKVAKSQEPSLPFQDDNFGWPISCAGYAANDTNGDRFNFNKWVTQDGVKMMAAFLGDGHGGTSDEKGATAQLGSEAYIRLTKEIWDDPTETDPHKRFKTV